MEIFSLPSFFHCIEKVAIKILNKTKLDDKTQRLLLREITSMEQLYHPNIIRLYEVIETPKELFIVTEYASGGDLYTRIINDGKIAEDEAKHIFAQITAAVDHMVTDYFDLKCFPYAKKNYLLFTLFSIVKVLFIET